MLLLLKITIWRKLSRKSWSACGVRGGAEGSGRQSTEQRTKEEGCQAGEGAGTLPAEGHPGAPRKLGGIRGGHRMGTSEMLGGERTGEAAGPAPREVSPRTSVKDRESRGGVGWVGGPL